MLVKGLSMNRTNVDTWFTQHNDDDGSYICGLYGHHQEISPCPKCNPEQSWISKLWNKLFVKKGSDDGKN